jgi:AraC-like DNA-binding protein
LDKVAEAETMRQSNRLQLNAVPTASGGIARAAFELACRARVAVEPILQKAGITVRQIKDPRARIAVKDQIELLDLIAERLGDEFLGIRLAQKIDLRELGFLYYVLASSQSVGEALKRAARYSKLQNEGVAIRYRQGKVINLSLEYVGVPRRADRHQIEFIVTIILRICRHLAGREIMPITVGFVHRRARLPDDLRLLFGTDVAFNNQTDEIEFAGMMASMDVVSADPYLNSLLVQYYDDVLASRHVRSSPWRLKVENAAAPLLPHGQAQIGEIARQLGVSRRTLSRRLAAEGQSFGKILDSLRFELAKRYLHEQDLPLSEISWLLGYRETAALNHAFKRWSGKTPTQARSEWS